MNTRRNFFGQLGAILAAASAPMAFIPSESGIWKPTNHIYTLKCKWSAELEQDLMAYHNINAEAEITALMTETIKLQNPDIVVKSIDCKAEYEYDHINFVPYNVAELRISSPTPPVLSVGMSLMA